MEDILEKSIADQNMKNFFTRKVQNLEGRVNTQNYQLLVKEKVIEDAREQEAFLIKDMQGKFDQIKEKEKQIKTLYKEVKSDKEKIQPLLSL